SIIKVYHTTLLEQHGTSPLRGSFVSLWWTARGRPPQKNTSSLVFYFPRSCLRACATWLAISAAVLPAPTPLSMLTTERPGAHVCNIESNAAIPLPPNP